MGMLGTRNRAYHTKSSRKIAPVLSASEIPTADGLRMSEFVTWTLQNQIHGRCTEAMGKKQKKEQEGVLALLASSLYCLCVRFFIIQLCDVLKKGRAGINQQAIAGYIHHWHHVLTEYDATEEEQTDLNEICSRTLGMLEPLWDEFKQTNHEGGGRAAAWEAFDSENPSEELLARVAPAHLSAAKAVDQQSANYRMAYHMMIGLETSIRVEEGLRLLSSCPYGLPEFNAELEKQVRLLGFSFPFSLRRRLNALCPHRQTVEMATDVVNLVLASVAMLYRPPPAGSLVSPSHLLPDPHAAAFEELCPALFSQIRRECGVESGAYAWSVAHRGFSFVEFKSNSKSGETFFFSHDGRFIVKTISAAEAAVLVSMLAAYAAHLRRGPSLLMRICGLYRLLPAHPAYAPPPSSSAGRFFVVALSVFDCGGRGLHGMFDLKGSTRGRKAKEGESVKKDLDWVAAHAKVLLPVALKRKVNGAVEGDARFLASQGVLDYSLLLGVHDCHTHLQGTLCRGVSLVTCAVQRRLLPIIRTVLAFKPPDAPHPDPHPRPQPPTHTPSSPPPPPHSEPLHPLPPASHPTAEAGGGGAEGRGGSGGRGGGVGRRRGGKETRLAPLPPSKHRPAPPMPAQAKPEEGKASEGKGSEGKGKGRGNVGVRWGRFEGRGGGGGGGMVMGAGRVRAQWEEETHGGSIGVGSHAHPPGGNGAAAGGGEEGTEEEEEGGGEREGEWSGPHGPIYGGGGEKAGERGRYVYFLGIVDFLVGWSLRKRVEYGLNCVRGSRRAASCVPPPAYAERHIEFVATHLLGMCTVNFAVQYGKRKPPPRPALH